eukprot:jgi/Hompol1/1922/HPOL_002843-RA
MDSDNDDLNPQAQRPTKRRFASGSENNPLTLEADLDPELDEGLNDSGDDSDSELQEFGISKHSSKIWLVKVPKFLADQWVQVSETNPAGLELGRIQVYAPEGPATSGAPRMPEISLTIPSVPWAATLPKEYTLRLSATEPKNEFIFTENSRGKAVEIVGHVDREGALQPDLNAPGYREILSRRTQDAMSTSDKRRQIVFLDDSRPEMRRMLNSTTGETWQSGLDLLSKKKVRLTEKRERMERQDLLDLLFALFAEDSHWTFKALQDRTEQPQQWLKEIISEICVLNKRGQFSGMYEIKPELRKSAGSMQVRR